MQFLITMLDPASCSIQPALNKDVSAFLKSLTSGRENKPEKNRKAGNNVKVPIIQKRNNLDPEWPDV